MAGVEEKRLRTTAKRKFTRCYNRLNETILNKGEKNIIITKFKDLKLLWDDVQTGHDNYLFAIYPDDTDVVTREDEEWLNELEERFELIEKLKCDHLQTVDLEEQRQKDVEDEKKLIDQSNENILTTARNRDSAKVLLKQEIGGIEELITIDRNKLLKSQIVASVKDVKLQLEKCKEAHLLYTANFNREKALTENEWIKDVYSLYEKMNNTVYKYLESVTEVEAKQRRNIPLKMERLKMPSFNGSIRSYAKFKDDFKRQVEVQVEGNDNLVYILKSCLVGEALSAVENIDNVSEVWERLDKKYGQPSLLIDMVMNEVRQIHSVRESDQKSFIDLVNVIEKGYADLRRLKLEKEMSNSLTVSLIEGKLPQSIMREWSKEVNKADSQINIYDKFPHFMKFLSEQRSILEYEMANLRISDVRNFSQPDQAVVNFGMQDSTGRYANVNSRCIIHKSLNNHSTEECRGYISKSCQEKYELLKLSRACWSCLRIGHRSSDCRSRKICGIDNCTSYHHNTLHELVVASTINMLNEEASVKCLLPLMKIKSSEPDLTVLWDSGASISLITFQKARELNLKGKRVELSVIKVGGQAERTSSLLYTLPLFDERNNLVNLQVYGIDRISQRTQREDITSVTELFRGADVRELQRPQGEIDVLIGFNHASLHPSIIQAIDNLVIMQNRFGKCLAGSHTKLKGTQQLLVDYAELYHVTTNEESFFNVEEMGIQCFPLCGNCRCGKCALGTKGLSIKEEREQKLIEQGLTYQDEDQCYVAVYPWVRDPIELPENYNMALHRLKSTEKRLLKNPEHANVYDDQITDMVDRGVARILSEEEIYAYKGPYYYICHHEVLKEGSSTPCRIVFNSSAKYMNQCLNDYWAKGAKVINNLIGILIRFRENKIAICGDIKKMYHAVRISLLDQHTHRFLWRNLRTYDKPDVYVMTAVSFGDKPAGNIAIAALRKTAERGKEIFPEAANTIINNTYVDDIIDSFEDEATAEKVTKEIDKLLPTGGFNVKKWITSKTHSQLKDETSMAFCDKHNVLGMIWDKQSDVIHYSTKLKFKCKEENEKVTNELTKSDVHERLPGKITKRMMLSQINTIFDPLGLIAPFTVKAKILLRNLWKQKLEWDEEIKGIERTNVESFLKEMFDIQNLSFRRCLKPTDAVGNPVLVTFSDASKDVFGACTYLRWKLKDETYKAALVASKNRVAPLKDLSIVRLELCAAVIAERLAQFVEQETRFHIERRYFFVDSQIVRSMIAKESHAFTTFVAVRLGEIHQSTKAEEWYWIEGRDNIADSLTRGKVPPELNIDSAWQNGPAFLAKSEVEWPVQTTIMASQLPEEAEVVVVSSLMNMNSVENIIDIQKYARYWKLIYVTARLVSVFRLIPSPSLFNMSKFPADFIAEAEILWMLEAQKLLVKGLDKGDYKRLCPKTREDGVIVVGGRVGDWLLDTYNTAGLILLPYNHRLSRLYAEFVHGLAHLGTSATVCKIRDRVWITRLPTMVNAIRSKCVTCKKLNLDLQKQVMSQVPPHRLKPAPAFYNTYIDFFGPFKVRGVINKRSQGKAFGVIFTCGNCRAVHCDLSQDYSMDSFLQTLRRFVSIRGYPGNIWSDCGSQLVAADKELRDMIKGFDKEKLREFGAAAGLRWHFSPPDAPWHNGCAEALIKSVKKAIKISIGDQVLSFPELQTVLFEASNIVNERPIGLKNKNIEDGVYLCPNNLILGRASIRVPSGPFKEGSIRKRYLFVQRLVDSFWKVWIRDYFPCLLIRQKWHVEKRHVKVGDIVLIRDTNTVRGDWHIGQIENVYKSDDKVVRQVNIRYKVPSNKRCSFVKRAIQSLVILLPVEDNLDG